MQATSHLSTSGLGWRLRVGFATALGLVVVVSCAIIALSDAGSSAAAQYGPPNTSPPTISGTPQVGNTLTANPGTWTGTGITYAYQWRRCDSDGGSCADISNANARTYTLRSVEVGNTLRVRVTATLRGQSASATSAPTAVIRAAAAPPATGCPSGTGPISINALAPPARLTVDGQAISPAVVGRSTQSVSVRLHVSACAGRPVQGALVYATAVPFNQFSIPPEQPTGGDGWATLTMNRQTGFPAARNQQLLVIFARARKASENPLGGISTRRLVSFPVELRR